MLYPYRRTQLQLRMHTNLSSILRSRPNKGPEPSRTGPEPDGSAGPVGLANPAQQWCDNTLCYRLPALPDWLSGDCIAVVHDLGLQIVVGKVMGMRIFQWSVGAAGVFWGFGAGVLWGWNTNNSIKYSFLCC
jgi:hypothetical protein